MSVPPLLCRARALHAAQLDAPAGGSTQPRLAPIPCLVARTRRRRAARCALHSALGFGLPARGQRAMSPGLRASAPFKTSAQRGMTERRDLASLVQRGRPQGWSAPGTQDHISAGCCEHARAEHSNCFKCEDAENTCRECKDATRTSSGDTKSSRGTNPVCVLRKTRENGARGKGRGASRLVLQADDVGTWGRARRLV